MALFTSYGTGYASTATTDQHVVIFDRMYKPDGTKRAVVWSHSAGGDATEPILPVNNTLPHLQAIASFGLPIICVDAKSTGADAPAKHWGNDFAQSRVTDAIAWLRTQYGASTTLDPILLGVSMGGLLSLNYMRANAVKAVGVFYPATSLQAIHDGTGGASNGATTTENAYGGAAGFTSSVVAHDPAQNTAAYANKTLKMWYSDTDTVVGSANQTAFANAIPTIQKTLVPGAGHADMTRISASELASFIQANL